MKKFSITLLLLFVFVTAGWSQSVTVVGREMDFELVYNDTLAIARTFVLIPSPGHSGWFRTGDFQFFAGWVTFTDPGSIGLTNVDTVEISMEQWSDTLGPTAASVGFYEVTAAGGNPIREVLATYDIDIIQDTNPTFFSFHGSGDPEMAPGVYVRFYVRLVGGFTGVGLSMKFGITRQP